MCTTHILLVYGNQLLSCNPYYSFQWTITNTEMLYVLTQSHTRIAVSSKAT